MTDETSDIKRKTIYLFPWGRVGLYLAILFWVLGLMTGVVGTYDDHPSLFAAIPCVLLYAGSVICGVVGLIKPGLKNRILGTLALMLTLIPLAMTFIKS